MALFLDRSNNELAHCLLFCILWHSHRADCVWQPHNEAPPVSGRWMVSPVCASPHWRWAPAEPYLGDASYCVHWIRKANLPLLRNILFFSSVQNTVMEIMTHIRDLMDCSLHFQPPYTWMWSFEPYFFFVPLLSCYFFLSKNKEATRKGSHILHVTGTCLLCLIKWNWLESHVEYFWIEY